MPQRGEITIRMESSSGGPHGFAARWAVTAAICLLATGCTAQFKHLKNEPLALATDDEQFDDKRIDEEQLVAPPDVGDASDHGLLLAEATDAGMETMTPTPPTPSLMAPSLMAPSSTTSAAPDDRQAEDRVPRAFDAFLALNDPEIEASRSSAVKTASLMVDRSAGAVATDRPTGVQPCTTSLSDTGLRAPNPLLPVVLPPPQRAATSPIPGPLTVAFPKDIDHANAFAAQRSPRVPISTAQRSAAERGVTIQNPYVNLAAARDTNDYYTNDYYTNDYYTNDDDSDDDGAESFILVEDSFEEMKPDRQAPAEFKAQPAKPLSSREREAADQPITSVGVNIRPPAGAMPDDLASNLFTGRAEIQFDSHAPEEAAGMAYFWQSPAFCHRPLYFEQPNLERYGRSIGPLDSALSAALFYANVPAVPYRMAVDHPWACVYSEDRGVGCVGPRQKYLPPASLAAALAEASVMTGLVFLIP